MATKAPALVTMGMKISAEEATMLDIFSSDNHSAFTTDDGKICSSAPEHFLKAFGSVWGSVFVMKLIDMEITGGFIAENIHTVSWAWNLILHPDIEWFDF